MLAQTILAMSLFLLNTWRGETAALVEYQTILREVNKEVTVLKQRCNITTVLVEADEQVEIQPNQEVFRRDGLGRDRGSSSSKHSWSPHARIAISDRRRGETMHLSSRSASSSTSPTSVSECHPPPPEHRPCRSNSSFIMDASSQRHLCALFWNSNSKDGAQSVDGGLQLGSSRIADAKMLVGAPHLVRMVSRSFNFLREKRKQKTNADSDNSVLCSFPVSQDATQHGFWSV